MKRILLLTTLFVSWGVHAQEFDTLYVNSFSSLFQEWQSTEEAKALLRIVQYSVDIPQQ